MLLSFCLHHCSLELFAPRNGVTRCGGSNEDLSSAGMVAGRRSDGRGGGDGVDPSGLLAAADAAGVVGGGGGGSCDGVGGGVVLVVAVVVDDVVVLGQ